MKEHVGRAYGQSQRGLKVRVGGRIWVGRAESCWETEKRVFKHRKKRSIYMREENIANTTLRGSGASGKASNLPTPNS